MPRPYKDDPRDCFKTFRFTAAELTRLEGRAKARRQTLSAFVRAILLGNFATDGPPDEALGRPRAGEYPRNRAGPESAEFPVSPRSQRGGPQARILTDQLRRVGTNLNQIAHRMNERRTAPPRELMMLLDQIRDLVRRARDP